MRTEADSLLYSDAQLHCCVAKVKVVRLLVGTFMTSLDMAGVSITIWPVTSKQLERLDAPSQVWCADHLCSTVFHVPGLQPWSLQVCLALSEVACHPTFEPERLWSQHLPRHLQAPGWPSHLCKAELHKQKVPLPQGKHAQGASTRPDSLSELGRQTEATIQAAADALIGAAQQLDEWDSRCE